jgi:hypothetical protein
MVGAAAIVMAISTAAWADDQFSSYSSDLTTQNAPDPVLATPIDTAAPTAGAPVLADAAPEMPLMNGLDKLGIGGLMESAGINAYGYVEVGYSYDATVPHNLTGPKQFPGNLIFFPGPDKNKFILDQVDLTLERLVDATKGKFDIGFRVEAYYGRDAVFTHSNGILDNTNKDGSGEDQQLDLEQAYLTFAIPVGSGLTVKAGKFDTLLGYETINPTSNAFYTHSYLFSYAVPFTQTGVLGSYTLNDQWAVTAGITRGWNQSTSDNNGEPDFLGQAVWTFSSAWTLTGNLSVGPQAFKDNKDYFVVPEIISQYKVSDALSLNGDFVYGFANNIAQWAGAAGYVDYTLNKQLTPNLRVEFYHDGHGATTGAGDGSDVNYWEFTANLEITPVPDDQYLQWLKIRPEVRYDIADQGAFDFNGTSGKSSQLTFAVDATYQF